jgi:hypothetical protein
MVQSFMDKLAMEFTEFTSASDLGVALSLVSENPNFRHGMHRDVGFKTEFQDQYDIRKGQSTLFETNDYGQHWTLKQ